MPQDVRAAVERLLKESGGAAPSTTAIPSAATLLASLPSANAPITPTALPTSPLASAPAPSATQPPAASAPVGTAAALLATLGAVGRPPALTTTPPRMPPATPDAPSAPLLASAVPGQALLALRANGASLMESAAAAAPSSQPVPPSAAEAVRQEVQRLLAAAKTECTVRSSATAEPVALPAGAPLHRTAGMPPVTPVQPSAVAPTPLAVPTPRVPAPPQSPVHYGAAAVWALRDQPPPAEEVATPVVSASVQGAAYNGSLQQRVAASVAAVDQMQQTAAAAARVQVLHLAAHLLHEPS